MSDTPELGGLDDTVRLTLGGDEVLLAEDWDISEGAMTTPGTMSVTLGVTPNVSATHNDQALFVDLFARPGFQANYPQGPLYSPGTPYVLSIGDAPQMSGKLEGFHFPEGTTNLITLKGRDQLCSLMKAHSEAQRSFIDGTYSDLVKWAISQAIGPTAAFSLFETNAGSRVIKAGVPISVVEEPPLVDKINASSPDAEFQATFSTLVGAIVKQEHQNRIHENLLTFVRRHIDRAGLFLWSGPAIGQYILSQPNGKQKPLYKIVRKVGKKSTSNVVRASYWFDTSDRHSSCVVYGRGGGAKGGRAKVSEGVIDEEMSNMGKRPGNLGFYEPILYRDVNVSNKQQAAFYARRKLAEERRKGWGLVYTVSGHRAPSLDGGPWPVLNFDTTIMVEDDFFGLGPKDPEGGIYYIESVRRMRKPETVTQIRLMRIRDLVFGTGGVD